MHYLHKILVYIPDVTSDRDGYEKAELADDIRRYAENETESFCEQAFDWRETATAGRWEYDYLKNVLFAEDDLERFVSELTTVVENQKDELQCCLAQLKDTVGTDLEEIAKKIFSQNAYDDCRNGVTFMTSYYLHCAAAYLHGEYRCSSYFYNVHDYTARLYPADIEAVKSEPQNWALVMFDYHY